MHVRAIAAAAALLFLSAGVADAAIFDVTTSLKGADAAPATASTGTGTLTGELDTGNKSFSYEVNYGGLSGPVTAAQFQGSMTPGSTDQPVMTTQNFANPIEGTTTLTDGQIASLEAGKWFLSLQTAAHPAGEVRGQLQVTRRQEEGAIPLN